MKPTREQLQELLRVLAATEAREIDCDEFLARVCPFLDSLERGQEPPPEVRVVSQHLEVCGECREEFDALVELRVQGDDEARG